MRKHQVIKDEFNLDYLRASAKMTPAQRLRWLEKTADFMLKALPKPTFRAMIKLRTLERA